MHTPSRPAILFAIPFAGMAQGVVLSDSEVFKQIHTKGAIHLEMEIGFFEFRIYRVFQYPQVPRPFLLEYRSSTGKTVVFECNSEFTTVSKVVGAKSNKNFLELEFKGQTYRYMGSTNAYYSEH